MKNADYEDVGRSQCLVSNPASTQPPHPSPFPTQTAISVLVYITTRELLSALGWLKNTASYLPTPLGTELSLLIALLGLLGVYSIIAQDTRTAYFALITPMFEAVLSLSTLGGLLAAQRLDPDLVFQTSLTAVLSFLAIGSAASLSFGTKETSERPEQASPADLRDITRKNDYAVEIIDVSKLYKPGPISVKAIDGLTTRIRRGEFVAIMGPSGSGKSTLLNLIGALDKPTSGRVLEDGVDISTLNDSGLAKLRNEKVGFVFQSFNLIARSNVLRNMELPALVKGYSKDERLDRVDHLLSTVGLSNKARRKPQTLSGGEQQRVAIARALVNNPSIILADEPTGNLDSKTGREVVGYLKKLNVENGTTVIVVTHSREVAEVADRILHLRDGKITQEEVVQRNET